MTTAKQLVRICLFRGADDARAAIKDLMYAGIAPEWIRVIGGSGNADTTAAGIRVLGIAERDAYLLASRIEQGGIVVAVPCHAAFSDQVEAIFLRCQAAQDGETATYEHDLATNRPSLQWCEPVDRDAARSWS